MTASTVEVRECEPDEPQARFCLTTYFTELADRFDGGFDPTKKPFRDEEMTPPTGLLLVATLHGDPVGCGAMTFLPQGVAYIKRMWVARTVRGLGLGRRLLAELEERARSAGVCRLQLETKDVLTRSNRLVHLCRIPRSVHRSTTSRTPITGSRRRSRVTRDHIVGTDSFTPALGEA